MKATRTTEIEEAIASNDVSKARKLISAAIKNEPDADIYYLASLVALDDNQKSNFINKALELDPFHEESNNLLEGKQSNLKAQKTSENAHNKQSIENIVPDLKFKTPKLPSFQIDPSWRQRIKVGAAVGFFFSLIISVVDGYWSWSGLVIFTVIGGVAGFISPPVKKLNILTGGLFVVIMISYAIVYFFNEPEYLRISLPESTILGGVIRGGICGAFSGSIISRIIYWVKFSKKNNSAR